MTLNRKGLTLVEVIVSMVLLIILALGISSVFSMISSSQRRSPTGSFDLQAANYARQTLENLKNMVSTDTTGAGAALVDNSYGASCETAAGGLIPECETCGGGTTYAAGTDSSDPDSAEIVGTGFERQYKVWDISDGNKGVAYKKVTVTVTWD